MLARYSPADAQASTHQAREGLGKSRPGATVGAGAREGINVGADSSAGSRTSKDSRSISSWKEIVKRDPHHKVTVTRSTFMDVFF